MTARIIDLRAVQRAKGEASAVSALRELLGLIDALDADPENGIDADGPLGIAWLAALARARKVAGEKGKR